MRGVILQTTAARLVDITHDFPRGDVRTAGFWLREVLPTFPPAVHLVVIDPGVGTERAAIVLRAGDAALVGPDNGVMVPAARRLAGEAPLEGFEIAVSDPESHTFHGRDVFAPAAARVHEAGVAALHTLSNLEPVDTFVELTFPEPTVEADAASGEVLVVDGFGNAITNLPGGLIDGRYGATVRINGERAPVRRAYAMVPAGDRLVTVGSHGNVELAANQDRGDRAFDVAVGDPVHLAW